MPTGALIGLVLVGLVCVVIIIRKARGGGRGSVADGTGATGGVWFFGEGDNSGSDFGGGGDVGGGGD